MSEELEVLVFILLIISLISSIFSLILINNPNIIPVPDEILKGRECFAFCLEEGFAYSEYLGKNEEMGEFYCECSHDRVPFRLKIGEETGK